MNPVSPFFAIVVLFIALCTSYLLKFSYKLKFEGGRYQTIDGLRGFLALGVFIHHSSVWYSYAKTGIWDIPNSNLFAHLGSTSVSFFFMITSFLFVSKLLNAKDGKFNWSDFFISRIFRLVPMFLVSLTLIVFCIMGMTQWTINVSAFDFLKSIGEWAIFTVHNSPNINNYNSTYLVNAGVIWSLPYEWFFYFSLPLLSLLILKSKPNFFFILISIVYVIFFFTVQQQILKYGLYSFAGGAIAPLILKKSVAYKKINSLLANIVIILCFLGILQIRSGNSTLCIMLVTIIFTLVAFGHSLFGLFKSSTLKLLGDISYSTYLLHGIILFAVIHFVVGIDKIKQYNELQYCGLIFLITPLIITISFISYSIVEKPFMNLSKSIIERWKNNK